MGFRCIAALAILSLFARAQQIPTWRLTRSPHFELYSQADDASSRSALAWFEQLRALYLDKTGLPPESLSPVRVISFRSAREYEPYRLHAAADAHFIGTPGRDYIVMSSLDAAGFATAAHEYAHSILHAAGLKLPLWLSEGLAEFFSTARVRGDSCTIGGDLPARSQTLQRHTWIPLAELLAMPNVTVDNDRDIAGVFYAESWALADMLVLAPDYASRFGSLLAAITLGTPAEQALPSVYLTSLDAMARDLHIWVAARHASVLLPGIRVGQIAIESPVEIPPIQARAMLADMLLQSGRLDRARAMYLDLARESPTDAAVAAALGTIALRNGDKDGARREWKRAIDLGIHDAKLCFDYASLAEMASLPPNDYRPALERAITLKPDFDDARFHLALIEKNDGRYEAAIAQLRAMHNIAPARAYHYWMAMTDAFVALDQRDAALAAVKHALEHAANATERARAEQLAYIAQTDFAVQFTNSQNGRTELQATRIPHNATAWNPFIEPGDKMHHVEGSLREIDCTDAGTRFVVETSEGRLKLAILDPSRVQMRNAPAEFTCGAQSHAAKVAVDYAESAPAHANVAGIVRGMEFR